MKYILAIQLTLSLYMPDIARIVAYADYVVDVMSLEKINLCDCRDILEQRESPEEHQQHIALVKTQWTYIITEEFTVPGITGANTKQAVADVHNKLPRISFDIFQPPRV